MTFFIHAALKVGFWGENCRRWFFSSLPTWEKNWKKIRKTQKTVCHKHSKPTSSAPTMPTTSWPIRIIFTSTGTDLRSKTCTHISHLTVDNLLRLLHIPCDYPKFVASGTVGLYWFWFKWPSRRHRYSKESQLALNTPVGSPTASLGIPKVPHLSQNLGRTVQIPYPHVQSGQNKLILSQSHRVSVPPLGCLVFTIATWRQRGFRLVFSPCRGSLGGVGLLSRERFVSLNERKWGNGAQCKWKVKIWTIWPYST